MTDPSAAYNDVELAWEPHWPADPMPPQEQAAKGLAHAALDRTFRSIHARLGEKITLQQLADAACMSRFHFARLFRCSTGFSPMEYLLHARLETAKAMLREGGMPLCDIAAAIGFADQSHFTRHFRRRTGLTPLQYARRCAGAPR